MSGAKVVTIDSGKNQFVITAEDILSKITFKNLHREVDTGDSVGNEF